MGADAESSCTESRTDSWSPDGARNPWSAPTTELWAPTRIATVRLRVHERSIDYAARRRAEGKTRREIIRCLKRHIAREIYRLLTDPPQVPHGESLRLQRTRRGLTIDAAAQAFHTHTTRISALERGTSPNSRVDKHRSITVSGTHSRAGRSSFSRFPAEGSPTANAVECCFGTLTKSRTDSRSGRIRQLAMACVGVGQTQERSAASSGVGACSGCGGLWRRSTGRGLRRRA